MKKSNRVIASKEPDPVALSCAPNAPDRYLTKSEIAERLRREPRTIERWMRAGIIPYLKIGMDKKARKAGAVLFSWPDVQLHLSRRFGVGKALN